MAFRLPKKASQWFTHISVKGTGFELEFDSYYFCLLAGLKTGRTESLPNSETTEIIQQFPKEYQSNRNLVIALFLHTELKRLGIELSEKTTLNKQLSVLVQPNTGTNLSDEGMRLLNQYSFGGFSELQNHFPEPPRTLDNFLVGFYQFLNQEKV